MDGITYGEALQLKQHIENTYSNSLTPFVRACKLDEHYVTWYGVLVDHDATGEQCLCYTIQDVEVFIHRTITKNPEAISMKRKLIITIDLKATDTGFDVSRILQDLERDMDWLGTDIMIPTGTPIPFSTRPNSGKGSWIIIIEEPDHAGA